MSLMHYKAMDEHGKTCTGRMEAANAVELALRLERMGLDLIRGRPARARAPALAAVKLSRRQLIDLCFQLEQLLGAGVAVLEALVDLRDTAEERKLREVIAGMAESIAGGKTLSSAMQEYPRVFDCVLVNLVRAGELSGQVAPVLGSIVESLKWQDEQAAQVKKLTTYPVFVGSVVALVLGFLMTYLVPQLVTFLRTMGMALPLHTRMLIWVADCIVAYWYLTLSIPVALSMVGLLALRVSSSARYALDELKIRIWLVGPIVKKIILARFAKYFALMYASGITVLDCIHIGETLVGNRAVAEATRRARRQIAEGASISAGFEGSGLFPPLVLRMLRVGESTGALDTALLNVTYFYERDVKESVARLQALVGPSMTIVLGGLLLLVIVSVLGPVYDLIGDLDL